VDGVEFALGGAYSAADTQVFVHDDAAAAEAAGGLFLYLLFGEIAAKIPEGLECFFCISGYSLLTWSCIKAAGSDRDGRGVESLIVAVVTTEIESLTGVYIAVD